MLSSYIIDDIGRKSVIKKKTRNEKMQGCIVVNMGNVLLDAFKDLAMEVKYVIHAMNTAILGEMTSYLHVPVNKTFKIIQNNHTFITLHRGPCFDTNWDNKEAQCRTAVTLKK
jgi:hypothetical protein